LAGRLICNVQSLWTDDLGQEYSSRVLPKSPFGPDQDLLGAT